MSEEDLILKMTPALWATLAQLERENISHNFRKGMPTASSRFMDCSVLKSFGLASWSESASQEWEDYSITQQGRNLLERYRNQKNSAHN